MHVVERRRPSRRVVSALLTLVLATLTASSASGTEAPGVPKIELEPPAQGLPDPPDPPYVAPLRFEELPEADAPHPRLLFSTDDLPEIRARIADDGSRAQLAWQELVAWADALEVGDPVADYPERHFGRDDLAGLGLIWHVTGDDAYLEKATELLDYVLATAPDYGAPKAPDCCEYYIRRAHKLNGLALAYDVLHPGLDEARRTRLLKAILTLGGEHVAHSFTAWWGTISTGSNITGNNAAAIGTAGLAIWGDVPPPVPQLWVARSSQLVRSYFVEGFDRNGAGLEGILYGNYGLRIPTFFSHAHERAGGANLLGMDEVSRQQDWVSYELLPGGGAVNPLNDARYYEVNPVHLTWATRHGRDPDLAGWIWEHFYPLKPSDSIYGDLGELLPTVLWHEPPEPGFSPDDVLPRARVFPDRGLVHVRRGWGADDLMASFESRHNDWGEGVHHNQDVNSFTLYAEGARLVVDSGYANWVSKMATGDRQGARSSETEAHNAVVADGRSQDFHGKGHLRTAATTATVGQPGSLDLAAGDARLAYLTNQPERADRYFLHVRATEEHPDYLAIVDAFRQGDESHDYTWFLHTEPGNTLEVVEGTDDEDAVARIRAPNGAGLDVTQIAGLPIEAEAGTFTASYDDIGTHPRLEIGATGEALEAVTLLHPRGPEEAAVDVDALDAEGVVAANVSLSEAEDLLLLRTGPAPIEADGATTDATFAFLRTGPDGEPGILGMADGTELDSHGTPLVSLDAVGTVLTSPRRVVVEGAGIDAFLVRAPGADEALLNGEPVDAERCGPYLVHGRDCPEP